MGDRQEGGLDTTERQRAGCQELTGGVRKATVKLPRGAGAEASQDTVEDNDGALAAQEEDIPRLGLCLCQGTGRGSQPEPTGSWGSGSRPLFPRAVTLKTKATVMVRAVTVETATIKTTPNAVCWSMWVAVTGRQMNCKVGGVEQDVAEGPVTGFEWESASVLPEDPRTTARRTGRRIVRVAPGGLYKLGSTPPSGHGHPCVPAGCTLHTFLYIR